MSEKAAVSVAGFRFVYGFKDPFLKHIVFWCLKEVLKLEYSFNFPQSLQKLTVLRLQRRQVVAVALGKKTAC